MTGRANFQSLLRDRSGELRAGNAPINHGFHRLRISQGDGRGIQEYERLPGMFGLTVHHGVSMILSDRTPGSFREGGDAAGLKSSPDQGQFAAVRRTGSVASARRSRSPSASILARRRRPNGEVLLCSMLIPEMLFASGITKLRRVGSPAASASKAPAADSNKHAADLSVLMRVPTSA